MELDGEASLNVAPAIAFDEFFAGYAEELPFRVVVVEVLVLCLIPLNNCHLVWVVGEQEV